MKHYFPIRTMAAAAVAAGTLLLPAAETEQQIFERTVKGVDQGGVFLSYLDCSTRNGISTLLPPEISLPEEYQQYLKILCSGDQTRAMALSSKSIEKNLFLNRAFFYAGKNAFAEAENYPLPSLERIPAHAVLAVGSYFNAAKQWEQFKQELFKAGGNGSDAQTREIISMLEQQCKVSLNVEFSELLKSLVGEAYWVLARTPVKDGENGGTWQFLVSLPDQGEILSRAIKAEFAEQIKELPLESGAYSIPALEFLLPNSQVRLIFQPRRIVFTTSKELLLPRNTAKTAFAKYFKDMPEKMAGYFYMNLSEQNTRNIDFPGDTENYLEMFLKSLGKFQHLTAVTVQTDGQAVISRSNLSLPQLSSALAIALVETGLNIQKNTEAAPTEAIPAASTDISQRCAANMKQVQIALLMDSTDRQDKFSPPNGVEGLLRLVKQGVLKPEQLRCPEHQGEKTAVTDENSCDYFYFGGDVKINKIKTPGEFVILLEKPNRNTGHFCVGYADGHVKIHKLPEFYTSPEQALKKLEQEKVISPESLAHVKKILNKTI